MGGRQELDGLLLKYYSEEGQKGPRQSERDTEIEAKEIFRGESDEEKAGKRQRESGKSDAEIHRDSGKSCGEIQQMVKRRKGRNKNVAEIERKHRDIR